MSAEVFLDVLRKWSETVILSREAFLCFTDMKMTLWPWFPTWAGGSDRTEQSREAFDFLETDNTLGEDWARVGGQACVMVSGVWIVGLGMILQNV